MSFFSWLKRLLGIGSKSPEKQKPAPAYNGGADYEEDEDEIVTLIGKDGEEVDFNVIAGISLKSGYYTILQPTELLDGMGEDEALVFKVTQTDDGEDSFAIELDDKIIDAVFAEYDRLLAEQG